MSTLFYIIYSTNINMSHNPEYDSRTIIIHGGSVPKKNAPRDINRVESKFNSGKNQNSSGLNAASLERKIDEGKIGEPAKISLELRQAIQQARTKVQPPMKQSDLATKTGVPSNVIRDMENGSLLMTAENKKHLEKVKRVLGLNKKN